MRSLEPCKNSPTLDALHLDLLAAALRQVIPLGQRTVLDLGCGNGSKTAWLRAICPPTAQVLGLDRDGTALHHARAGAPQGSWLCADAHAMPLRSASLDLIWCIAALGLMRDPASVLLEAQRSLRPGGSLVLATVSTRWVRLRPWSQTQIAEAASKPIPAPADDLGADLCAEVTRAGFAESRLRAYLLDPPGLGLHAAALPLAAGHGLEPDEPQVLPILFVVRALRHGS